MPEALKAALLEFNRAQPATSPWYRFPELSAANQSRVEQRAEEIAKESMRTLCASFYPV